MAHLALDLLGPFRATLDDEPVSGLQSPRLQALLAYLAVETDREHPRRSLAEMIWPNRPEGEALAALRYALSNLRTAIGDREADSPFLHITRSTLRFNTDSDYTLDVERFQHQIAAAEATPDGQSAATALRSAVDLYRGDFLEGLFLPHAARFEEWSLLQREVLVRKMTAALRRLAITCEQAGAYQEAQVWAERWLRIEPWNEAAHRQLMRALALSGQRTQALAQYETCRRRLKDELGVAPGRATRALRYAIRKGQVTAPARWDSVPSVDVPAAPDLPFVAREDELARLDRLLDEALAGQGRVAFLTGEAGSGKTALWCVFARRAMEAHSGLVVAAGQSSAQAGTGDPYLPFREILQTLTGDVEPQRAGGTITPDHARRLWAIFPAAAQTLVTYGPDLVDRFVPGRPLLFRAEAFAPSGASWLSRLQELVSAAEGDQKPVGEHQVALFEQVTTVLRRLAQRHPLVLVVDDLQWADRGSLGLLFHLGRRLAGCCILLIGTYRPGDVVRETGGRHPLDSVVSEFRRDFGEVEVDLDQASGRAFVEAYLDAEPNLLDDPFRETLARHTGGNPLFTVEMVHALRQRGDLFQDEAGRWVAGEDLNWGVLPARVEAVIAERVGRLSPEAQRTLRLASVVGESFSVEVLARIEGVDRIEIIRRLDGPLSASHRLVRLQRVDRLPRDGRRLSIYQFQHVLFQNFFYRQLSDAERVHLHNRVGVALEAMYQGDLDRLASRAPVLAHHFQEAGAAERAIYYRQRAGERAIRLSANEEAIYHFTQGLELVETLPATAQRDAQEIQLLLALILPVQATRGHGAPETGRIYDRMLTLCRKLGDMPDIRPVTWQLGTFYTIQAEYDQALEVYERSLKLAKETGYDLWNALAHWARGNILMVRGQFRRAIADLQYMVECYDPERHYPLAHQLGYDPGVGSLTCSAWALWSLGYPDQALERIQEAVALAKTLDHQRTQVLVAIATGLFFQMGRYGPLSWPTVDEAQRIADEQRFPACQIILSYLEGLLRTQAGERQGIQQMARALAVWKEMGHKFFRPYMMALLAEAYGEVEQVERGLALTDEALALAEAHDERYFEAEICRLRGELFVMAGDEVQAQASFRRAIDVAQELAAKSWELRATMSLSRLLRRQGKAGQARRSLESVYGWFSEGLETADLLDARSLLDELAAQMD